MEAKGVKVRVDDLPALADVFPSLSDEKHRNVHTVQPYPFDGQTVDVSKPTLYIHSSGSTGFPKSVGISHRRLVQWMVDSKYLSFQKMLG